MTRAREGPKVKYSLATTTILLLMPASLAASTTIELRRLDLSELPVVSAEIVALDSQGGEIPGLRLQDFDITLDGDPLTDVRLEAIGTGSGVPPVMLLVDRSGDLAGAASHTVKKAAAAILDRIPMQAPVAVYAFDRGSREEAPFTTDRKQLRTALTNIRPGRGTGYLRPLREAVRAAKPGTSIIFIIHIAHYPGPPPRASRAYRLPGSSVPIYPVVVPADTERQLDDRIAGIARQLSSGLRGIYRLAFPLRRGVDGEMHSLSLALRDDTRRAKARFRAARGLAIKRSPALDRALRNRFVLPWKGALAGALLAAIVLVILSSKDLPVRLTLTIRFSLVGIGAVVGAIVALLAFPTL